MLNNHTASGNRRTSSTSTTERGFSSGLDPCVYLGKRHSSLTLFSERGIDLYVDLSITSDTGGSFGDDEALHTTRKQSSELRSLSEDADYLEENSDRWPGLNVDDAHPSEEQIKNSNTVGVVSEELIEETLGAETCTDKHDTNAVKVDETKSLGDMQVENIDVQDVNVVRLQKVQSAADSSKEDDDFHLVQLHAANTTALLQDKWNTGSVNGGAITEMDVWDDAEIVAIQGLTRLQDELRFEKETRSCNSGEVAIPTSKSNTPRLDPRQESTIFPDDDFYHIQHHLEYLSKRIRRCQASVQQLILASDMTSVKTSKVCKDCRSRRRNPKRVKHLSSRSQHSECEFL